MPESTLRQLQLLQFIPRYPSKISTSELKAQLKTEGFDVSMRMIQRDLESLELVMGLQCDDRERPYGWSWSQNAQGLQPYMEPVEALTFALAGQYLEPLMPSKNYAKLKVFFERAESILKTVKKNELSRWRERVRIEDQWLHLESPKINEDAEAEIYKALLYKKQINVNYRNRGAKEAKKRIVNPLGLILRGKVHYLICTMDEDKKNPRFLALHRFEKAQLNGNESYEPDSFSIDKYIKDNNLGFLYSDKKLNLKLNFYNYAGSHLFETPISKEQKIKDLGEGKTQVKALQSDTGQLRWWILGFGGDVEVVSPKSLRTEIKETIKAMNKLYD